MSSPRVGRPAKGASLVSLPANYVVVDLETTGFDPKYDHIIEVAALRVVAGTPDRKFSALVDPGESLDPFITALTGITPEMLDGAPSVADVLPLFLDFVGNDIVVGHNVNFDINFIYDACEEILGKPFTNDFVDVMRLSRHLWKEEKHHRLCDLVSRFGIQERGAHRAMIDVVQTFACYQYIEKHVAKNDIHLEELFKAHGSYSRQSPQHKLHASDITANCDEFDEMSPIFGKTFVFTGALSNFTRAEAMQEVVDRGGICADNVKKSVDYLVLGCLDYCATVKDGKSAKRQKAESMKLKGSPIEIISENTFLDMLNFE